MAGTLNVPQESHAIPVVRPEAYKVQTARMVTYMAATTHWKDASLRI